MTYRFPETDYQQTIVLFTKKEGSLVRHSFRLPDSAKERRDLERKISNMELGNLDMKLEIKTSDLLDHCVDTLLLHDYQDNKSSIYPAECRYLKYPNILNAQFYDNSGMIARTKNIVLGDKQEIKDEFSIIAIKDKMLEYETWMMVYATKTRLNITPPEFNPQELQYGIFRIEKAAYH